MVDARANNDNESKLEQYSEHFEAYETDKRPNEIRFDLAQTEKKSMETPVQDRVVNEQKTTKVREQEQDIIDQNKSLPCLFQQVKLPKDIKRGNSICVLRKNITITTPKQQNNTSDVQINIKDAIRAAKELIQKSELLKREIAKNANRGITPKMVKAAVQASVKVDQSSVQDSSLRDDFNEYREILQSHTENYSDDDFASSVIESMNISQAQVLITEGMAADDRATPRLTLFPDKTNSQQAVRALATACKRSQKVSEHKISMKKPLAPSQCSLQRPNPKQRQFGEINGDQGFQEQVESVEESFKSTFIPQELEITPQTLPTNQNQKVNKAVKKVSSKKDAKSKSKRKDIGELVCKLDMTGLKTQSTTAESTLKDSVTNGTKAAMNKDIQIIDSVVANVPAESQFVRKTLIKPLKAALRDSQSPEMAVFDDDELTPIGSVAPGQSVSCQSLGPIPITDRAKNQGSMLQKVLVEGKKNLDAHKPLFSSRVLPRMQQSHSQPGGVLQSLQTLKSMGNKVSEPTKQKKKQLDQMQEQPYAKVGGKSRQLKDFNSPSIALSMERKSFSRNSSQQSSAKKGGYHATEVQQPQKHQLMVTQKNVSLKNKLSTLAKDFKGRKSSCEITPIEQHSLVQALPSVQKSIATDRRNKVSTMLPDTMRGKALSKKRESVCSQKTLSLNQRMLPTNRTGPNTNSNASESGLGGEDVSPVVRRRLRNAIQDKLQTKQQGVVVVDRKKTKTVALPSKTRKREQSNSLRKSLKKQFKDEDDCNFGSDQFSDNSSDKNMLTKSSADSVSSSTVQYKERSSLHKDFIKNNKERESRGAKVKGKLKKRSKVHSDVLQGKTEGRKLSVSPNVKQFDYTTTQVPSNKLINLPTHRQLQSVESRNYVHEKVAYVPRVTASMVNFQQKMKRREKIPTELVSKDGDQYSWKYYYKLSKARKAQQKTMQAIEESQGPTQHNESQVACTGLQSAQTQVPLINVNRDFLRSSAASQQMLPLRISSQKSSYQTISKVLDRARNITSTSGSNNRNLAMGSSGTANRNIAYQPSMKTVNSEALLQKTKLWEQRALKQSDEAKRNDRSLRETGKTRKQIDGQIIGALHAKLQIMNQIQL